MRTRIDTELARLDLVGSNLVVAHLLPGVKITESRVLEVRQARLSMIRDVPVAMLAITTSEMRWEPAVLGMNFFGTEDERIKALAVVVLNGSFLYSAANLYFVLNPGKCPVKLVETVEAGYAWLEELGFARSPMEDTATLRTA